VSACALDRDIRRIVFYIKSIHDDARKFMWPARTAAHQLNDALIASS